MAKHDSDKTSDSEKSGRGGKHDYSKTTDKGRTDANKLTGQRLRAEQDRDSGNPQ